MGIYWFKEEKQKQQEELLFNRDLDQYTHVTHGYSCLKLKSNVLEKILDWKYD